MTSSATESSVGGTVSPSILLSVDDQLELDRLHDRQVRRLRALEDATSIDAKLTKRIRLVRSVAHQSADFGKFTVGKCRWNCMPRRRVDKLNPPVGEQGVGANEKCVRPLAQKSCEGRVDLPAGTGVADHDLQPHGVGSRYQLSYGLGSGISRIDENANTSCSGHQCTQEFQPLCRQLSRQKIDAGHVSARPGQAGDKTKPDRVIE